MNRIVDYKYSEAIGYVFDLLPIQIAHRLEGVHFLTGTDPVYAGLHKYIDTKDGRSYRNTAHACYPYHVIDKYPVIVLTEVETPYVIMHEIGHIIDFLMDFSHIALPVNEYARTNREEAFAEAWASQYFWLGKSEEDIFQSDISTQHLFERLNNGMQIL